MSDTTKSNTPNTSSTGTPTTPGTVARTESVAKSEASSVSTTANRQEADTQAKVSGEASATADKAKAEASRTYETAAEEAARLKDKAIGLGTGVKSAATDAASRAADEARTYARSFAEEQKGTAAAGVRDVSRALNDAADDLDERFGFVAGYVRDAAGEVDRVASSIKDRSVDDLLYSVESFARRQPTAFLGASVLAGFALARFVKSSAREDDYDTGYRGAPHYPVPAERSYQGGAPSTGFDEPYAEAGIPHRAVNPPNRQPAGSTTSSNPSDLASGVSASATPAAATGGGYKAGAAASSPVSGSGAIKSA